MDYKNNFKIKNVRDANLVDVKFEDMEKFWKDYWVFDVEIIAENVVDSLNSQRLAYGWGEIETCDFDNEVECYFEDMIFQIMDKVEEKFNELDIPFSFDGIKQE